MADLQSSSKSTGFRNTKPPVKAVNFSQESTVTKIGGGQIQTSKGSRYGTFNSGRFASDSPAPSSNPSGSSNFVGNSVGGVGKVSKSSFRVPVERLKSQAGKMASKALDKASVDRKNNPVIQGTIQGIDNLTGALISVEGNSATSHKGVATGSNVSPIGVLNPAKIGIPGVPAQITRGTEKGGNRKVQITFDARQRDGRVYSAAITQVKDIVDTKPLANKQCQTTIKRGNNPPEPPEEPPATPPQDNTGEPPPEEAENGSEYQPPNPYSFGCVLGECVPVINATVSGASFPSLQECQAVCAETYTCNADGFCVPDPNGTYPSLSDCEQNCTVRFNCVSNTCTPALNGTYTDFTTCNFECDTSPCGPKPRIRFRVTLGYQEWNFNSGVWSIVKNDQEVYNRATCPEDFYKFLPPPESPTRATSDPNDYTVNYKGQACNCTPDGLGGFFDVCNEYIFANSLPSTGQGLFDPTFRGSGQEVNGNYIFPQSILVEAISC